jgi:multiple sugar transport system ATP-binding protein
MASVRLRALTKSFGGVTALENIDLEIKDKEFFVLLGPTGAGKTTMLRIIAGLEKPNAGEVFLDEADVNDLIPAKRDVAFVFQYYTLYPNLSVRENLEFPLRSPLRAMRPEAIAERVAHVAKVLRIGHLLDRSTTNLSGGEMQRVAIGRAIVRTPKVFLMDEPLSNLDAKLREAMRAELAHLHLDLGSTFFYVTHDQIEAMTMGDRIAVMNRGRILQVGTPDEVYNHPTNLFVAKFVGSPAINSIPTEVSGGSLRMGAADISFALEGRQARALKDRGWDKVTLGIRPEDIEVTRSRKQGNCHESIVYFMQSMGAEDILNLKFGDMVIRAVAPPNLETKIGETVYANVDMGRAHMFDSQTDERLVVEG